MAILLKGQAHSLGSPSLPIIECTAEDNLAFFFLEKALRFG